MLNFLLLLILCWPFGGHRNTAPQPPTRQPAGKWFVTPHWEDGYWREYVWTQPPELSKAAGFSKGKWEPVESALESGYVFHQYRWEWKGIKLDDKTWYTEGFPGKPPDKPKRREWIPDYDPFLPGTKYNL